MNAIEDVKDKESLKGSAVVNLEPCAHYEELPLIADLLVKVGVKRVVLAV